ncbi:hypothetical protein DDB_G0281617 [Dictyostelium discoideum AX4]|uniref:Uncharacterized protein n=1 Tax=Dictyostelium discoideum TaxID=44689 RepID=Q54TQ4_DICDI|nr:hypothetical protein DDB_G0281617 [Dictyostelium discoideum AX4]EAL66570.1 hypothetical protein DDB_G0281617 [Dictyostelium discoideum AX4]|eukprot:XP_640537.1 hypothetical protein DDB_G0281617 [Dictyostelium discoideum AX4]
MPLALTSRKSLKDNEESLKTNLAAIEKSLGEAFAIEFDFEDIITKCNDSWVTNSCGSIFYKDVVGNLTKNMAKVGADPLIKEAFLAAVPNKKFVFICADEKLSSYWKFQFENGDCQILFRPKICNTNDVNTFKLETIIPTQGVYTLSTRLNIKTNEQKMKDNLAAVKKALKSSADWSIDETSLQEVYPKVADDLKNSFGHIFAGIVEKVAANLTKRCSDEMILEAVQEATSNHTIVIKHDANLSGYWSWSFESGNIVITFKSITNTNDVQTFDFIKLL